MNHIGCLVSKAMAIKSLKKRFSKRSSGSYSSNSSSSSMASSTPVFRWMYGKTIVLILAVLFVCVIFLFGISWNIWSAFVLDSRSDRIYSVEVVNEFPHDPEAFTQGLLYAGNDTLFESTGLKGRSSVRRVDLRTGKIKAIHRMQHSYFGEGLTLLGEKLFQVTWLQNTGFIYDRNNLSKMKTFTHQMKDGWGLTTDGKVLFGSDGTSTLYQIDPITLKVVLKHIVKYKGREVPNLNELEYVNGEVWANVYQTDCIARISVKDGNVTGWLFLPNLRQHLLKAGERGIDVLNGIAWDKEKNRLFVTGKLWPKLFEIKLKEMKTSFYGNIEYLCIPSPFQV